MRFDFASRDFQHRSAHITGGGFLRPQKKRAESKIRRVKDRIILVEGSLDFHYFTETCKKKD